MSIHDEQIDLLECMRRLAAVTKERDAEYYVRKLTLFALEGQGLPKELPENGFGVIQDAYKLREERDRLTRDLDEARAACAVKDEAIKRRIAELEANRSNEDIINNRAAAIYYLHPKNEASPFGNEVRHTPFEALANKGMYRQIYQWHVADCITELRTLLGGITASPTIGAACKCSQSAPTYPAFRNTLHLPDCRFFHHPHPVNNPDVLHYEI